MAVDKDDEVADDLIEEASEEEIETEEVPESEEPTEPEEKPEESGEVVITIGDEKPEDDFDEPGMDAPAFIRLREAHRAQVKKTKDVMRRLDAMKAQMAAAAAPATVDEPGPEPDMADDDVDWDKEKFRAKWNGWNAKKLAADRRKEEQAEVAKKAESAYQEKLAGYVRAKTELKVADFEDAEAAARETFSPMQQSILVKHTQNPAAIIYALGKSPDNAKKLAAITDPIEFAIAARDMEKLVKVQPKKAPPAPERAVHGNASVSAASTSKQLDKLREEAAKTGDITKVIEYKRQLAAKKA
jgi:hypothetical protein